MEQFLPAIRIVPAMGMIEYHQWKRAVPFPRFRDIGRDRLDSVQVQQQRFQEKTVPLLPL
ncbi:hypothetical protein D1872_338390 [compost metagenome]